MGRVARGLATLFGYDATEDRGRRKSPPTVTYHEDEIAKEKQRRILSASSRDLARNFAVAAWAIRKHLDYVSSFTLQSKTGDSGLDADIESYMKIQMGRHRFDAARRHPFRRAIRLAEACRVKDGDILWIKLAPPLGSNSRGKIQAIEADRIRMPTDQYPPNADRNEWMNGVRVSQTGAALAYAICRRTNRTRFELQRIVSANNVFLHAFYDRYDQVRGISPIAAGLNWFRDTYEGFEYSLAKAKIGQLFGIAFERDGETTAFGAPTATADADEDGTNDSDWEVTLPKGMFSVELNPGEQAKIIEAKTPSSETVDFLKLMVHVALKTLDIPYSFFDESFTNFYGSRGGLIQYLKACKDKVSDLQDFQNDWLRWRLGLAIEDGDIRLPRNLDFSMLRWEFVPDGVPWWDPIKEVRGHAMGVAAGFTSPQRVCREVGTDFEENMREISDAMRIAGEYGVDLVFADSTAFRPEITTESEAE